MSNGNFTAPTMRLGFTGASYILAHGDSGLARRWHRRECTAWYAAPSSCRETAGIRRGNFPTQAQAQLARGALQDAANLRLLLGDEEVPLQASAGSRWPDGSIRQVEFNFNTSIGPLGELRYRLEIGGARESRPVSSERLEVIESSDGLQVGKLRFARQPAALLQSVAFGREIVGDGLNAVSVTDANGATYLLGGDVTVEIVKPGPLAVQIRYAGTVQLPDDYAVPFTLTLDVPNTKSWVKYGARIEDPRRRIREVAFNTSFRLGAFSVGLGFRHRQLAPTAHFAAPTTRRC